MSASFHPNNNFINEQSNVIPLTNKDRTIAIIQISRMGDVLQTILATKMLKSTLTNIKFIFIGRIQFAKPFEFLLKEVFHHIYYLNFPKHYWISNDLNLSKLNSRLKIFLSSINQHEIESVINLTFSKSSSYLVSLINSKYKIGLIRNKSNNFLIGGRWSQFVYSNVMTGDYSPFNLVDIFKNILIEAVNSPLNSNLKASNILYSINNTNINQNKIIIHPFASHLKKFWKSNHWQYLLEKLLADEQLSTYSFIIIGSLSDEKNHPDFISFLENNKKKNSFNRISNKIGKLDVEELANEISTSSLFIGHDSMGGHLAAIYHIPTITISIGSVRAHETTPYGENNFNIIPKTICFPCFPDTPCHNHVCHLDASADLVYYFIHALLSLEALDSTDLEQDNKQNQSISSSNTISDVNDFPDSLYTYFSRKIPSIHLKTVNIYQSFFLSNGIQALSVVNTDIDFKNDILNIFKSFYHILWSFILSDEDITAPIPEIKCKKIFNELKEYLTGLKYLADVNNFGEKYSLLLLEELENKIPNIAVIQEFSKKIQEIDKLTIDLKQKYPLLSPLVDYYHVCKGNLKGDNIIQMATSSLLTFKEAKYSVNILKEFIEKTLDKSRKNFYSENNWVVYPEINSTRSES